MHPKLLYEENTSKSKLMWMKLRAVGYVCVFTSAMAASAYMFVLVEPETEAGVGILAGGFLLSFFLDLFFIACLFITHKPMKMYADRVFLPHDKMLDTKQTRVMLPDITAIRVCREDDADKKPGTTPPPPRQQVRPGAQKPKEEETDFVIIVKTKDKEYRRDLLVDRLEPGLVEAVRYYEEALKKGRDDSKTTTVISDVSGKSGTEGSERTGAAGSKKTGTDVSEKDAPAASKDDAPEVPGGPEAGTKAA